MKVQTTIRQRAAFLACAMLIAMLGLGLVACNADQRNEEIIRSSVTEEFEAIKSLDEATLKDTLGDFSGSAGLDQFGITSIEFCKAWLSGFDFAIDDIAVDGSNATVTVTVTVKSIAEALAEWQNEFDEFLAGESADAMDEDARNKAIGVLLMDSINNTPLESHTVTLPYVLEDRTWVPGPGFGTALNEAFGTGLA